MDKNQDGSEVPGEGGDDIEAAREQRREGNRAGSAMTDVATQAREDVRLYGKKPKRLQRCCPTLLRRQAA